MQKDVFGGCNINYINLTGVNFVKIIRLFI